MQSQEACHDFLDEQQSIRGLIKPLFRWAAIRNKHLINLLINDKTLDFDNLQCLVCVPSSKDVGAVNICVISSFLQHFLQGESESQQVNTHCQTKLEQEPPQEVLLGLGRD